MITRITGLLESLDDHAAVLVPAATSGDSALGVAYEVLVPAYLSSLLLAGDGVQVHSRLGSVITLHTLHYFEGVNQGSSFVPRLLGFGSTRERDFFELLTTVKGLGNRRALRALAIEPGQVARSIVERDTRVLQRLPEIGPKLAEALVHELKSKAEAYVGLRVDVGALSGARGTSSEGHVGGTGSATPHAGMLVESKETLSPGATAPVTRSVSAGADTPKSAPRSSRSAAGRDAPPGRRPPSSSNGVPQPAVDARGASSALTSSAAPSVPPVRQTVQALIALGEQPMEAERMVARAVDRAAASGALASVCDPASLLTAAYQSR